jgi:group II intron reverse transcriptase/maturase
MNIGEMQRKLSEKAETAPEHRFENLYSLLCHREWLTLAHDYVAQNAGSLTAGCDGITMKDFDKTLETQLQSLVVDLKAQRFEPSPVRRVYIPKAHGKVRPLGILAIRDRIVQEAVRMILEPIYEADFSQYSYGFRPNRCTMDAIRCITNFTKEHIKFFWIIEGDLASYFDTINHRKLLKLLRHRIKDDALLTLIWKFLRAGVMEKKLFRETYTGTPQGGILSPLLANVYLHPLDKYMTRYTGLSPWEKQQRRRKGQANYVYARYCDDFVVLCNGTKEQAEALRQELATYLHSALKLTLSRDKTKVTHINEGFKFLGFWIQRKMGHKGMTTKVLIPKEAFDHCLNQVRTVTDDSTHKDSVSMKILALNRVISGWCHYYRYTSRASTEFHKLEYKVFWYMIHWLGRKFRLKTPDVIRRFYKGDSLAFEKYRLTKATEIKTKRYTKRFIKPNPYTTQPVEITREAGPVDLHWMVYEKRSGTADLRLQVLERDRYRCQICGQGALTQSTAQMDHRRPMRRFKLPVNANRLENLWTLCIPCHKTKTKTDQQAESLVP